MSLVARATVDTPLGMRCFAACGVHHRRLYRGRLYPRTIATSASASQQGEASQPGAKEGCSALRHRVGQWVRWGRRRASRASMRSAPGADKLHIPIGLTPNGSAASRPAPVDEKHGVDNQITRALVSEGFVLAVREQESLWCASLSLGVVRQGTSQPSRGNRQPTPGL